MEFNATFIISMLSFIVFVFLMNRIFYAPITKIVEERENIMNANYNEADDMNNKANTLLTERDEKLALAEDEARKTIADKIKEYNDIGKAQINEAVNVSSAEINEKKNALQDEYNDAKSALDAQIESLASTLADKVLGTDITVGDVNRGQS